MKRYKHSASTVGQYKHSASTVGQYKHSASTVGQYKHSASTVRTCAWITEGHSEVLNGRAVGVRSVCSKRRLSLKLPPRPRR
jgi:hypothetical protein